MKMHDKETFSRAARHRAESDIERHDVKSLKLPNIKTVIFDLMSLLRVALAQTTHRSHSSAHTHASALFLAAPVAVKPAL